MIPVHGLVPLKDVKIAAQKLEEDTKLDEDFERYVGEVSAHLDRLCGRRLIFRSDVLAEGDVFLWEPEALLDLTAAVPTPEADARFTVGIKWVDAPDGAGTLVITGLRDAAAVEERIEVSGDFEEFIGREILTEVTSVEVEDSSDEGEVQVNLYRPYEEFHDTERSTLVYAVNRPLVVLDEVAEGGIATSYIVVAADNVYVFERDSGRIQKVGFSGAGTSGTLGPDYPDDEFFRFPRGRSGQAPAWISGSRAVRLRYTGGYLGDKLRRYVPHDLKALCKKMVVKMSRGEAFEDVELTSTSDSAGSRSRKTEKEWAEEVEAIVRHHRSNSATARVQLA